MQDNQLEAKMFKQIGVSLQSLEWFILQGFMKSIVEDSEKVMKCFSNSQDVEVIESILAKIQKQYAPHLIKEVEADSIEAMLDIKPKELFVKPKTLIY